MYPRPRMVAMDINALLGPDRREVRAVMVATVTGSASAAGTSESLGNDTDAQLLQGLRDWAEVIVVGASTVRAEDYGGATSAAGTPAPIAVVTGSADMDPRSRFFTDYSTAPLLLVPHAALAQAEVRERTRRLEAQGAEIIDAGTASPADLLACLRARGYGRIVCEGGPGLLSQFVAADAVDAFYLTLDPTVTSAVETPVVRADDAPSSRTTRRTLDNCAPAADGTVFLRYRRARRP